ncbi:RicAFT regulatory complex protein RicA family protein [Paenibacillus sp. GCM10023252]|uniref:RicAFT regulatory complex protein RicA family protein n=1 Tax=Paenibacillus sp. GCM10023252 TaxID=3252649 RepID=UPI003615E5F3
MSEHQAVDHKHDHDHNHNHEGGCGIPSFDTRDLLVREDIMNKAKQLADLIYTSEEVQHYRRAEQQIVGNDRVQGLIATMKKKQKELVAFQTTFKNEGMVAKIEQEIEELQDQLDEIPIVAEFQQSQSDINYLLQLVVSIVRETVSEKITVEDTKVEAPEECD